MEKTSPKLFNIKQSIQKKAAFMIKVIFPAIIAISFATLITFRTFFVTFVDKHELGYSYNKFSGAIHQFERTGYFAYLPWVISVHSIDLRPMQLQITANSFGHTNSGQIDAVNQRVLNAKLVRFNPNGLEKFIEWHGRNAGDSRIQLAEILRCYAFNLQGGKDCPFLTVEREIAPPQTIEINP